MDPSQRVRNHMNKDHQLALVDYLVVYGKLKLSDFDEKSPEITAIDEVSMVITYNSNTNHDERITFKWDEIPENENVEVKTMKDLKGKLVAMAKYAAEKQGYSHVKVTKYPYPTRDTALMVSILVINIIGCYDLNLLKELFKNDPITSTISPYFPDFLWKVLNFAGDRIKLITVATYAAHLFENVFVLLPKLRKYRVPFPQSVCWLLFNFVEGFFTLLRFNKLTK